MELWRHKCLIVAVGFFSCTAIFLLSVATSPQALASKVKSELWPSLEAQIQRNVANETVIPGEHERKKKEFLEKYVRLGPEERVQLWVNGPKKTEWYGGVTRDMQDVLIATGTDAVPSLIEVIHNGHLGARIYAVHILCDMDRFVPPEVEPLPEVGPSVNIQSLGIRGSPDPFLPVDGRRIGKNGLEAVQWASQHAENEDLRFYARLFSDTLKTELQGLSKEDQLRRWRDSVAKAKGSSMSPVFHTYRVLDNILIERIPDVLPTLLHILETDKNPYVREALVELLAESDLCRMRLRGTKDGLRAITDVEEILREGHLKPVYKNPSFRAAYLQDLKAQFFQDQVRLDTTSRWALYAKAFDHFYGENVTVRKNWAQVHLVEAKPEFHDFVTYLTGVDPMFPSWEYTYCGTSGESLHPQFRAKVARYYEQWKRFQAQGHR